MIGVAAMLMPFRKKLLPAAPSAVNVLWRSLVAHQRYDTLPTAPLDAVMRPPIPRYALASDILQRHVSACLAGLVTAQRALTDAAKETRLLLGRPR